MEEEGLVPAGFVPLPRALLFVDMISLDSLVSSDPQNALAQPLFTVFLLPASKPPLLR